MSCGQEHSELGLSPESGAGIHRLTHTQRSTEKAGLGRHVGLRGEKSCDKDAERLVSDPASGWVWSRRTPNPAPAPHPCAEWSPKKELKFCWEKAPEKAPSSLERALRGTRGGGGSRGRTQLPADSVGGWIGAPSSGVCSGCSLSQMHSLNTSHKPGPSGGGSTTHQTRALVPMWPGESPWHSLPSVFSSMTWSHLPMYIFPNRQSQFENWVKWPETCGSARVPWALHQQKPLPLAPASLPSAFDQDNHSVPKGMGELKDQRGKCNSRSRSRWFQGDSQAEFQRAPATQRTRGLVSGRGSTDHRGTGPAVNSSSAAWNGQLCLSPEWE